jgi:hypothetical protein
MSATIHEETLTVSKSTIVDLIAALEAAGDLIVAEDDRFRRRFSRSECSDAISSVAGDFRTTLLGPAPEDDDAYRADATLVELTARCSEFEADMIMACRQRRVRGEETRARLEARDGRAAQLREHAKRIRKAGDTDSRFPDAEEMRVLASTGRDDA